MKIYRAVFNSDAVNKYGSRFSIGALVSMLNDNCLEGVPMAVAHDRSRLVGWSYSTGLFFEPSLTRLVGTFNFSENDDESSQMELQLNHHKSKMYIEPNRAEIKELRAYLSEYLNGDEKVIPSDCIGLFSKDLARRVLPELFAKVDKDNLIELNSLKKIGLGVFKIGEFAVFAHRYFRRNLFFENSLNYPLLRQLDRLSPTHKSIKIAIDPDMIGLAKNYQGEIREFQYWWGPKFSDEVSSIQSGISHHEADELDKTMYGISATQFRWGKGKKENIFESEELRDIPSTLIMNPHDTSFACRYAHAIFDSDTNELKHFDGAIRMYSEAEMIERLDVNLDQAPRNTVYTKLWRMDEPISIVQWKSLLSDHYRDNYLVGEYLGGEDVNFIRNSPPSKDEIDTDEVSIQKSHIPYSITKDLGLRIGLSYAPVTQFATHHEIEIFSLDKISLGEESHHAAESLILELKKYLKRKSVEIDTAQDIQFLTFKDNYYNLPLIVLKGEKVKDNLKIVMDGIKHLANYLQQTNPDAKVCYKIAFPIDDSRIVIFSILGHVENLNIWHESRLSGLPNTQLGLKEWSSEVGTYLSNTFQASVDEPEIFNVFKSTGVLHFDRIPIHIGTLRVLESHEEGLLRLEFAIDEVEYVKKLEQKGIVPGFGFWIKGSECSKCSKEYLICDCSKLFDQNVNQIFSDCFPLNFWMDKLS